MVKVMSKKDHQVKRTIVRQQMRSSLCIGETVMRKCTAVVICTPGGACIFSSLITPTHYGGLRLYTIECTIPDETSDWNKDVCIQVNIKSENVKSVISQGPFQKIYARRMMLEDYEER